MIYGIGTDLVNIERVKKILSKNREGFIKRVLSEHEQALFANKADSAAYCAKRFAAKEAFAKASLAAKRFAQYAALSALLANKACSCSLKTLLTKPSRFFERIFFILSMLTRSVPIP